MTDFKEKLQDGLKEALKQKDHVRLSLYRMLLTSIKNKEVEKIRPLTEDEFIAVVKTSIKQHVESIESFKKGDRADLAEREEKELSILKEFMPSQLSEDEVSREIEEAIVSLQVHGQKEMGKVIKFILEKYPGRIDGKVLSGMVLKRLSSK
ncbi:MAG TPA: GatB/YqeY domain-containing protein [Syntrophorhabdus sp.]|nr:GatB/YqeY domain-containing protein [Syntrophorhabdus sp.]HPW36890.1 GatB/YqeY domain-containing protein [Syntrophorhabdus sp.]HQM27455.1 GatB/YqeY domain-containing protein [Syntrophorhabdus sp.]HQO62066.1 GatB/YqeY domain-containing protein [Syntrophorhabdus sp.]